MSSRKAMGEVRPDDNKIRIFGARRADGALGARETRVEGLALPNSVESGTLNVKKAGIRGCRFKLGKLRIKDNTAPEILNAVLSA
jgi:hypothetical protein